MVKVNHILFVCRQNQMRSRTAETIFGETEHYICRSAGLSKHAPVHLDKSIIDWADIIFVMQEKHKRSVCNSYPLETSKKEIIVLDIEDHYYFMEPALVDLLETKVRPYLDSLSI